MEFVRVIVALYDGVDWPRRNYRAELQAYRCSSTFQDDLAGILIKNLHLCSVREGVPEIIVD